MTSEGTQDHCDWCMGPLSEKSRMRSRWLGLLAGDVYLLSEDDLVAIVNALNEVLHGASAIDDREFQTRIGVSRAVALQTLRRVAGT